MRIIARMDMYERAMLNETPQDLKEFAANPANDDEYRRLAAEVLEEIEEYGPRSWQHVRGQHRRRT